MLPVDMKNYHADERSLVDDALLSTAVFLIVLLGLAFTATAVILVLNLA